MKFIAHILGISQSEKKLRRKPFDVHQQELLVKQGREQFKKLIERGLQVPVALL